MSGSNFRSDWERVGAGVGARQKPRWSGDWPDHMHIPPHSRGGKRVRVNGNESRGARTRPSGIRALALASCVSFRSCDGEWDAEAAESADVAKRGKMHICCPETFFCEEFLERIRLNREHERQRWIFELIAGRFAESETVFLDEQDWLLVEGCAYSGQSSRYLVIFKDLALHTVRNLRQKHVEMLKDVQRKVRGFLETRHGSNQEFRLYFHYLPSVFQLHMHVCSAAPVDVNRRQYLSGVIRNLMAVDTWYRDALMLFASSRAAREGAGKRSSRASTSPAGETDTATL